MIVTSYADAHIWHSLICPDLSAPLVDDQECSSQVHTLAAMLDVLSTTPFPLRPGLRWPFGLVATAAMLCCVLVPLPPAKRHFEQNEPLFAQHRQCTGRDNLLEVVSVAQLSSPKLPATSQAAIMHLSNGMPPIEELVCMHGVSQGTKKLFFTSPA